MRVTIPLALTSLLATAAPPARAAEESPDPPTLTVTGEAEVSAEPDRARIVLGATVEAKEAAAAQSQVSGIVTRALAALRQAGARDEDLETTGVTLHPVRADPRRRAGPSAGEDETPGIVAYRASNTVQVRVDDPTRIGAMIDAGIGAGANELLSLAFELSDDTKQRAEALATAVGRARHKAEALARAAGVRLVALHRISESGADVVSPVLRGARTAAFEAGTPVQLGRIEVHGSVTLTYRIAPAEGDARTGGSAPDDDGAR